MDLLEKIRVAAYGDRPEGYQPDLQGWMQQGYTVIARDTLHTLCKNNTEGRPLTLVEVGVWKGTSAAQTAHLLRELGAPAGSRLVAVDTFLGSSEHQETIPRDASGRPTIYDTFRWNMQTEGLTDLVYPFPIPSLTAAAFFINHQLHADMIYIDGAHEYRAVKSDLEAFWKVLRPGGALLMDDYAPYCPGVMKATNEFVTDKGLKLECAGVTARTYKPLDGHSSTS